MKVHVGWVCAGLGLVAAFAACSNQVTITAEKAGATSGSTGTATSVQGSGPGGTGGATGSGSTSTGTGGVASGGGKVVSAETDIGQYQSLVVLAAGSSQKVVAGPFFVTDVYAPDGAGQLDTVTGADCSVPQGQHLTVLDANSYVPNRPAQLHGIRLPVLAGQTLCALTGANAVTVLGFRPY